MRGRLLLAAIAVLAAASSATAGTTTLCVPGGPWTATEAFTPDHEQPVGPWSNQTLREVAHVTLGGSQLRVGLSNEFGLSPVTFAHVSVAQQLNGATSVGMPTVVTFGGATSVTLAAGAEASSDAVAFPTTPGERLLVSVYIPSSAPVTSANLHTYSGETEYNIVGSDATMAPSPAVSNTFNFTSFLGGLDVDATSAQTVVAVGDSITDLGGSPLDSDDRWPDYLSRRTGLAVVDAGISGNQVLADEGANGGPSLQHRWQHDVLGVTGARTVAIEDGLNDLRAGASASALESALAGLAASAHAAGLRVILTTITPCSGASLCTSAFETQRQAYNSWVRGGAGGAEDGFADFDAAVGAGTALAGMYDSGDHIHPNAAGMLAMAETVNASQL